MRAFTRSSMRLSPPMFAITLVLLTAFPIVASGAPRLLRVANNGTDSVDCGNAARPCRSINQAIENAVDGDQIEVGAGHYGDLNADGDFDDSGEEGVGDPHLCATGTDCRPMVNVNKRLRIFSSSGAAATVIDGAFHTFTAPLIVVEISTDGSQFGREDGGFTIIGGLLTIGLSVSVGNVWVVGNAALNCDDGGFIIEPNGGRTVVANNVATSSGARNNGGFRVRSFTATDVVVLRENIAFDNPRTSPGFQVSGIAPNVIVNNRAIRNGAGFVVEGNGPFTILRNIATANFFGFQIRGGNTSGGHTFSENSVIGNVGPGFQFFGQMRNNVIRRSNIFGNGANNCGVLNSSGQVVLAKNNYWGRATGPGPDPADNAGPGCDSLGSETITRPFATEAFPIE